MAFVELNIIEPENNQPFEGSPTVRFTGEIVKMPSQVEGVTLYYRWYSSLYEPQLNENNKPDYFSIERNVQLRPDETFFWQPGPGSHAITFAVTDRAGEILGDLQAVCHAGVTGGSPDEGQCLIHVFKAILLPPEGGLLNPVQRDNLFLIAEAPFGWAKPKPETDPIEYELNSDYHAYNRLRYRWEFIPKGSGSVRETLVYLPSPEELSFGRYSTVNRNIEPTSVEDVMVVYYKPDYPNSVVGEYTLKLHVEDKNTLEEIGHHEDFVDITIQE